MRRAGFTLAVLGLLAVATVVAVTIYVGDEGKGRIGGHAAARFQIEESHGAAPAAAPRSTGGLTGQSGSTPGAAGPGAAIDAAGAIVTAGGSPRMRVVTGLSGGSGDDGGE